MYIHEIVYNNNSFGLITYTYTHVHTYESEKSSTFIPFLFSLALDVCRCDRATEEERFVYCDILTFSFNLVTLTVTGVERAHSQYEI